MIRAKKVLTVIMMVALFSTCFAGFALGVTDTADVASINVVTCQAQGVAVREDDFDESPAYGLLWKGDKFHVSNLSVGATWYLGTPDPATNLAQYYYPSEIRGYAKAIYFNVY